MMTEKRTETRACDLINRQAVTDTVRTIILGFFSDEDGVMTDTEKTLLRVNKAICDGVRALPSAQPDFDITVKIDKAYDDGYDAGFLQGRHDWGDLDE